MDGTIEALLAATATFVCGHFILSSLPVRRALISGITEGGFRIVYTLAAFASLFWIVTSYGNAAFVEIWTPNPAFLHVTHLLVLIAVLFVVIGAATRSPTALGGEKMADDPRPMPGILTITRHPLMIGVAIWSVAHLLANGDLASIILFGGMLALSVIGTYHIDYRRSRQLGSAWAPIALSTSVIPFAAILSGRTKLDLAGIGLVRVAIAIFVYAALAFAHPWIAGVRIFG